MEKDQPLPMPGKVVPRFSFDHEPLPPGSAPLLYPHQAMLAAMGGAQPLRTRPAGFDDSAISAERLQWEREQDYFNDVYLLAPVGYFVLGLDTAILQMNLCGGDLLGVPRDGCAKFHFRNFVCQRFLADFDLFVRNALNSSHPERIALQMSRSRQERGFPVTLLASADGSGQAFRVVLELAEGKLSTLERSEERFRRIVHTAGEGIWEIDAAARTTFVNPKMAQMLGYRIEDMLDQPLVAFMDDEGRGILERNIARRRQGVAERHEFKFLRRDGSELWATLATNPIFDGEGVYLGALALVSDITPRQQSAELIWRQANFDALTALPNRHMFLERLRHEIKKANREGQFLALLFIDLDHFKQVNDAFGHDKGDRLLAEAAARLGACVRATDMLARLGGDEFTMLLSGLDQVAGVERIAQQAIACLARPFELGAEQAFLSASIGIALYPGDSGEIDELMRRADYAMYAAKNAGRNRYSYFTADQQQAAQLRQRTALDLRQALAARQFELHYQPIVNLRSGRIRRAEALLRWRHPERGLLNPADFMPFAESSGLIIDIGDWVFRQAVRQVKRWQGELAAGFQVSVNKSPVQFRGDVALYRGWADYLIEQELPQRSIVIDITEGVLLDGTQHVIERLLEFQSMGLQVALDNFGTGYSSLSHLKKFDIDFLKIDHSFVRDLEHEPGNLALCEAIVLMAHKLGLKVIAEGVETQGQRRLLTEIGCDYAQGYLFSRALPEAQFAELVRAGVAPLAGRAAAG